MANVEISVELRGAITVLEALAAVSKHAAFAQKTALRAAGRNGRSGMATELAAKWGVPKSVFRKRARFFNQRGARRSDPKARARLWLGTGKGIAPREARAKGAQTAVLAKIQAQNPQGFQPKLKSGHRGVFDRVNPSRPVGAGARERPKARGALPIKEYRLDYSRGASDIVERHAKRVMRTVYVDTFKKDYRRRIDKLRRKNNSLLQSV